MKNDERLRYARRLYVYAKSRTEVPQRFKKQIIELNVSLVIYMIVDGWNLLTVSDVEIVGFKGCC